MSTRGNGRILKQKLSPFLYVAYYHNGKEQRELARHRRTGEKLVAAVDENGELIRDANYEQAGKYLKHRIAEVITEQHGGPAFITPQAQRATVDELLDDLVAEYKLGGKRGIPREVSPQMESHLKRVRDFFGEMRAVSVSKRHTEDFISALKAEGKQNATVNRSTQLLSQAFKIAAAADPPKVLRALKVRKLDESGNVRKGKFIQAETEAVASSLPEYMADAARFAYVAGTRAREILKLRWPYVEGDAIVVPAADTKNREGHTIVIARVGRNHCPPQGRPRCGI